MTRTGTRENRKTPRIPVEKGVWVAWQLTKKDRHVSRVRDLSAGGVFISTSVAVPVGTTINLLFTMPEGETRTQGIVRYSDADKGIGIEFTKMGAGDRARLQELLRRLAR